MISPKSFGLESFGRRFAGLLSSFGGAKTVPVEPIVTYGYVSTAGSTLCPFIIKPSSHQRVVIEAHRSDWL